MDRNKGKLEAGTQKLVSPEEQVHDGLASPGVLETKDAAKSTKAEVQEIVSAVKTMREQIAEGAREGAEASKRDA